MSVINKVLKDLDQRQQPHGMDNITAAHVTYPVRSARWPWVLVAILMILAAGYFGYWLHGNAETTLAAKAAVVAESTPVPKSTTVPAQSADKASVTKTSTAQVNTSQAIQVTESIGAIQADLTATVSDTKPNGQTAIVQQVPEAQVDQINEAAAQTAKQQQLTALANKVIATPAPQTSTATETPKADKQPAQTPSPAVTDTQVMRQAEAASSTKTQQGTMAVTEVKLTPQQLAKKRFGLAMDAKRNGDMDDAMQLFNQVLTIDPSMHQARKQLAAMFYGRQQYIQASEVLEQGLALYPKEYEFIILLARVQLAQGHNQAVLALLKQIPASSKFAMEKWALQSDIAQKLGQFELAEQGYRKLAQHQPEQPRWWMGLAYALDSQANYTAAKTAYKQALLYPGLSSAAEQFIKTRLQQLGE